MANRPVSLLKGQPLYWRILLSSAADATPTVEIRRNGDLVVSPSVSITEVGGAAKVYDCVFTPGANAEEGDIFLITETVSSASKEYEHQWNVYTLLPERGTENSSPTDTSIEFTVLVQDNTLALIESAVVRVYDSLGTPLGITLTTKADGSQTVDLEPGTYLFAIDKYHGYDPHTPTSLVVSAESTSGLLLMQKAAADSPFYGTADEIDLSGIKRVKTKNMEIEVFDPVKVLEARHKAKNPLPSFCSSQFCIGIYGGN